MKKNKRSSLLAYDPFKYFVFATLVVFVAVTAALLILNARISKLEADATANRTTQESSSGTPICQQTSYWMTTSGGAGASITSISGNNLTIDGYPGTTFHLCDNARIYGAVSGKALGSSDLKKGEKVWMKVYEGYYIKVLQVASE